jgi:hypothetical protein
MRWEVMSERGKAATRGRRVLWRRLILVLLCALLLGHYALVSNVFDEIYYDTYWYYMGIFYNPLTMASCRRVDALDSRGFDHSDYVSGGRYIKYKDDYLAPTEGSAISIRFRETEYGKKGILRFRGSVNYATAADATDKRVHSVFEGIELEYEYSVRSKTLTIEPLSVSSDSYGAAPDRLDWIEEPELIVAFLRERGIDRYEIERYRDYFLRDLLIKTWTEGNGWRSKFFPSLPGLYFTNDLLFSQLSDLL